MDAPEYFTAVAAENKLREAVVTDVAALPAIGAGMHYAAAYQFFLHLHEDTGSGTIRKELGTILLTGNGHANRILVHSNW